MKKKIMVMCSIALTSISLLLTSCNGLINPIRITVPDKSEKIRYAISYYENLKKETLKYIEETNLLIQEIKESADQYENELEYQRDIDELAIELLIYESNINEYDYQILLLQSSGGFNEKQKLLGIKLLESKIAILNKQLVLKEKHLDYYQEDDFKKLRNALKEIDNILQSLIERR